MPLTYDFKQTIRARAQRDSAFRQALLRESVECILNGDLETGKSVLRDYVNATVGFQTLEKAHAKSVQKPDANARTQGQPFGGEPLQHPHRPSENGRRSF
jgi:hypothetical protein